MKTVVGWIVAFLLGCVVTWVWINRADQGMLADSAKVNRQPTSVEVEFMRHGVLLQEYCRQGVSFEKFADQLVQVWAAYRVAAKDVRKRSPLKAVAFERALEHWEVARDVWSVDIRGDFALLRSEERLQKALGRLDEKEIKTGDPVPENLALVYGNGERDQTAVSTKKLSRLALSKGIESFQYALDFLDVETAVRKIQSLESIGPR